jgi:hypothetical protein
MDNDNFSEILNDSKDLTIGQIFKLITKIKYKVMIMFIGIFLTITGSAYVAGQANIKQETAVMLQTPFSMRIALDNETHDFESLTLMEDPMLPSPDPDTMMLSMRQIQSAFDIVQVGQIKARVDRESALPIWRWLFSSVNTKHAYAKAEMVFEWNGHEKDYNFKERHIDNHTVHRYYADGCILEYKLDDNRRSIPESFRWIKRAH